MAGRGAYQKKTENIANVRLRHGILIEGIKTPSGVDKAVLESLSGQRTFSALDLPKVKITPIALNTLKSLSDELFTDPDANGRTGFAYLDALRIRLKQSLSEAVATRTIGAKSEREADKINKLEARLTATEAQSVKRQKAYLSLYSTINGLIKNGDLQADAQERLYRALENHHAAFADLFEPSTSSDTRIEVKVINLREKDRSK